MGRQPDFRPDRIDGNAGFGLELRFSGSDASEREHLSIEGELLGAGELYRSR
jgi:hypothetical protein